MCSSSRSNNDTAWACMAPTPVPQLRRQARQRPIEQHHGQLVSRGRLVAEEAAAQYSGLHDAACWGCCRRRRGCSRAKTAPCRRCHRRTPMCSL